MATKAAKAPVKDDFAKVFQELRTILQPYATKLRVAHDDNGYYYLETKSASFRGRPVCFGAVRRGKGYVSFYLMTVYAGQLCAPVEKGSDLDKVSKHGKQAASLMSPELKKHMQGKSCFNFKRPEPELFKELALLTKRGFEGYQKLGWL